MPATWDTFERYRQKGLDARRAGQWDSARIYLLEAARAMLDLSKTAQGEQLQSARRATAPNLLQLARDCETAKQNLRPPPLARGPKARVPSTNSDPEGATPSPDQWIVKEKPKLRFSDVAGLDEVKEDIRLRMIYPFAHPELAERFDIKPG